MFFRDQKQQFKSNNNFTTKRGLLYSYLDGDNFVVKIINILPEEDQKDKNLSLNDIYNKYQTLIDEKEGTVSILQYFQINDDGQNVQSHLGIVEMELKQIKQKFFTKKESDTDNVYDKR